MPPETHINLPGSITDIQKLIKAGGQGEFVGATKEVKQEWIVELLRTFQYEMLPREDKGLLRQFIQQQTGYSRAQCARHITASLQQIAAEGVKATGSSASFFSRFRGLKNMIVEYAAAVGSGSTIAGLVILVTAMSLHAPADSESLLFLNGSISDRWSLQSSVSDGRSLFPTKDALTRRVQFTAVRTVASNTDGVRQIAPLFVQREEAIVGDDYAEYRVDTARTIHDILANVDGRKQSRLQALVDYIMPPTLHPSGGNYRNITSETERGAIMTAFESLVEKVMTNQAPAHSRLLPVTRDQLLSQDDSVTWHLGTQTTTNTSSSANNGIVERVINGHRYISLPNATIPQVPVGYQETTERDVMADAHRWDVPLANGEWWDINIDDHVELRRVYRLQQLLASQPTEVSDTVVASEPALHAAATFGALPYGREGQILMIVNGVPTWSDYRATELAPHGDYISRRAGGSGRGGGGGGGGSTTTGGDTYITNNYTTTSGGSSAVFVGTTSVTSYTGSMTYSGDVGYEAANAICDAEFTGSHFCRTDEIIGTISSEDIDTLFSGVPDAWIAEGPPGFTADSNDCRGWTSDNATHLGAWWEFSVDGGGVGYLTNCSTTKPLACCR